MKKEIDTEKIERIPYYNNRKEEEKDRKNSGHRVRLNDDKYK